MSTAFNKDGVPSVPEDVSDHACPVPLDLSESCLILNSDFVTNGKFWKNSTSLYMLLGTANSLTYSLKNSYSEVFQQDPVGNCRKSPGIQPKVHCFVTKSVSRSVSSMSRSFSTLVWVSIRHMDKPKVTTLPNYPIKYPVN